MLNFMILNDKVTLKYFSIDRHSLIIHEIESDSSKFTTLEPDSLESFLFSNKECVILDVRTKEEFEGKSSPNLGTLKNAIHIPYQDLETRSVELEKYKNQTILVYCARSRRSLIAAEILSKKGFKKIINLNGGIQMIKNKKLKK
ncbi:MAG: rhodanese-like domain-containing protein [Chloroherpetonaceae bacterium]|nr:rhodanese-like domain-containing protein [Chloroherpetonaceae bacterium]